MIEASRDGGVWTLTLNRPDKANALTRGMLEALLGATAQITDDPSARVLVLTGAGTTFSAGADLREARAGLATDPIWEDLSGAIAGLPCLTIAAINGTVAGGAFGMVLACDLRVAVSGATFFYPVMRLGLLPQPSDPARLERLVGPARTRLLLMAGVEIAADDALRYGLVDQVVPEDELEGAMTMLSAGALKAEREHLIAIKRMCP